MDRRKKYLENNRDLINQRARAKYQANKEASRFKGKLKMKLHREKRVRNLYPEWFKMTKEEFLEARMNDNRWHPSNQNPFKYDHKKGVFTSDMKLIYLIRGFKTHLKCFYDGKEMIGSCTNTITYYPSSVYRYDD